MFKALGATDHSPFSIRAVRNDIRTRPLILVRHEWRTPCAIIGDHMCPRIGQRLKRIVKGNLRPSAKRLSISSCTSPTKRPRAQLLLQRKSPCLSSSLWALVVQQLEACPMPRESGAFLLLKRCSASLKGTVANPSVTQSHLSPGFATKPYPREVTALLLFYMSTLPTRSEQRASV